MPNDKPKTDLSYADAVHAMQTGVAYEMSNYRPSSATDPDLATSPKHLRVGINSALCDNAALARLLVDKGIITEEEYAEAVRIEMCREVDRYEERNPGITLR